MGVLNGGDTGKFRPATATQFLVQPEDACLWVGVDHPPVRWVGVWNELVVRLELGVGTLLGPERTTRPTPGWGWQVRAVARAGWAFGRSRHGLATYTIETFSSGVAGPGLGLVWRVGFWVWWVAWGCGLVVG
jgi:hypothetical protein